MSYPSQNMQQPGYPPAPPPPPGPPPQNQGTNGLAIAGFILAFLFAPLGFILSLIGAITAGKRGQKGKGLAISGIVLSLVFMVGGVAVIALAANSTKLDPGCTTGKQAILDNT